MNTPQNKATCVPDVIVWKVLTILPTALPSYDGNILFNVTASPGLFSRLGVNHKYTYVPNALEPTVVFHSRLQRELIKHGVLVKERKFPYLFDLAGYGRFSVSLAIKHFSPSIISITVTADVKDCTVDDNALMRLQNLHNINSLNVMVQTALSLVQHLDHKGPILSHRYIAKPALLCSCDCRTDMQDFVAENRSNITKLLIRNDASMVLPSISSKVFAKNENINLKDSNTLQLIDKQGVLQLSCYEPTPTQVKAFKAITDLLEVSLLYTTFLESFDQVRGQNPDFAEFIFTRIRSWILSPDIVLKKSVSNIECWEVFSHEYHLRRELEEIETPDFISLIQTKRSYFSQIPLDWWKDVSFAKHLAPYVSDKDLNLRFITDPDFKLIVRRDFSEAERSFTSRNYKASIVLSGSICEAILATVLVTANPTDTSILQLGLDQLIRRAEVEALVKDQVILKLLNAIKDYRNMIHPGKEVRKSMTPDEHKAKIGLEVIKLLVKQFY